jgi:glycosyltransferase involved in cell wall biosynthesis
LKKRRVVFVYSGGREARWTSETRAQNPTEFFYGAVEMEQAGWDVEALDFQDQPDAVPAKFIEALLGSVFPVRVRAEHLLGALAIRNKLRRADVLVLTTSYIALAVGLLQRIGFAFPPIVAIHCGIANHPPTSMKQRISSWVLGHQDSTFFADAEAAATAKIFDIPATRLHPNAFGVDTGFWSPAEIPTRGEYILAVGNDARRDYATLVRAAASWDMPVRILTKRTIDGPLPDNVQIVTTSWHSPAVTDQKLRELYRGAAVVVVPVSESIQPSGQSVALQAMACGRPVALSRTSGLWTGEDFSDGEHLVLVDCSSSDALAGAVQTLLNQPRESELLARNARARAVERGDISGFANRLADICTKAAAWHGSNSAVG